MIIQVMVIDPFCLEAHTVDINNAFNCWIKNMLMLFMPNMFAGAVTSSAVF